MSYQVLARKWRPTSFDELQGQAHVATPLRNAIRSGRVPHAILLTGPRGVGKTTIARLLARGLNCEKGPTDTPCGECDSCREIAAGTSTDVQEIDAASHTSVDDVRDVIESVRYAPAHGRHRIFVIDEVHMLSTAAFNALLKTLEEPPSHSVFVLATTNPEKVPFTVVSRCQRYDLRRLPTSDIQERLAEVAKSEGIKVTEASLAAIARESDGSLRDALTLLDQILAIGGTEVDEEQVAQVLDLIDRRLLLGIVRACVEGDPAEALAACGLATDAGIDAKRLGGALLRLLRDLVVLRVAGDAKNLVEASDAELAELRELAEQAEPTRVRRMFRALLHEQEDLAWAPEPVAVLEMALVRLATMPAADDVADLLARLDALERRLDSGGGGARGGGAPSGSSGARPRAGQPKGGSPKASPAPAASAPEDTAPLSVVFDRLRSFGQERDRGLFAALEGGELLERSDRGLRIALPTNLALRRLESRMGDVERVFEQFFGQPVRVRLEVSNGQVGTAPGRRAEPAPGAEAAARALRQQALNHPAVNDTLEILGGEILEIRPLGSSDRGDA